MSVLLNNLNVILKVGFILLLGVLGSKLLQYFSDTPEKVVPEKRSLPVEVVSIELAPSRVEVTAYGTVEAARSLEIRPQVSGHVIKVHPSFEVGGRIKAGEILFEIDPRDYEIAVDGARANLAQAQFLLKQEQGNQIVAKREWELLSDELGAINDLNRQLALREPQLKEKQAALRAAQGQLKKAKLDLERTKSQAPFDILVLEEVVEVGQFLSQQSIAAKVVSTKEFYIQAKLPRDALKWTAGAEERPFRIIQDSSEGEPSVRAGAFVRNIGTVDPMGRMAKILISVKNPLDPPPGLSPLLLGSYVRVEIEGRELKDAIKISRAALREGSRVWVVGENNLLEYRDVEVVFSKDDDVFIRGSFQEDEKIVTSPLKNALRGTPLRILSSEKEQELE
jgi:RND family efflux transporter MFP subunit